MKHPHNFTSFTLHHLDFFSYVKNNNKKKALGAGIVAQWGKTTLAKPEFHIKATVEVFEIRPPCFWSSFLSMHLWRQQPISHAWVPVACVRDHKEASGLLPDGLIVAWYSLDLASIWRVNQHIEELVFSLIYISQNSPNLNAQSVVDLFII